MLAAAIGSLFPAATGLGAAGGTLISAGGVLNGAAAGLGFSAAQLMAAAQALAFANSMSAGGFHGGGIAGSPNMFRSVSPFVFLGATRYHTGGLAGLQPNEVPAILQRGEEVITQSDPRHRFNRGQGGGGSGDMPPISVVGVFNPDEIPRALTSVKGERAVVAVLGRNKVAARQALGID
jgi:hypothetical protein